MSPDPDRNQRYWRSNLKILSGLLCVWFVVSCVLSIFLVEPLNKVHLAGFPLGFWIAQQGSIIVFILLVLAYAIAIQRLDRKFKAGKKGRH